MAANQQFNDDPEFDEFFRRGEESYHPIDSLQPVVGGGVEEDLEREPPRTAQQRARRKKLIKLVSVTMALMTVGSIGAFTVRARARAEHALAVERIAPVNGARVAASMQAAVVDPNAAALRAGIALVDTEPGSLSSTATTESSTPLGRITEPSGTPPVASRTLAVAVESALQADKRREWIRPPSTARSDAVAVGSPTPDPRRGRVLETDVRQGTPTNGPASKVNPARRASTGSSAAASVSVNRLSPTSKPAVARSRRAMSHATNVKPTITQPDIHRPATASFPD